MSVAKRRKPYEFPTAKDDKSPAKGSPSRMREATERQESLRQVKMDAERVKEKLQASVLDNPKLAKKAAVLITLWMDGKVKPRRSR